MIRMGDYILIDLSINGVEYYVVASNKDYADRTVLKKLLNKGVSLVDPSNPSTIEINKMDIQTALLDKGFYFINPEYYHKECLGCGRKITLEEANKSDRICCGGGVAVLPEWQKAERNVLRNVSLFKKK